VTLRLDWAGHDAAAYACRHWHYSRAVPAGRLIVVGVWEGRAFKGVVIFSRGATPRIGSPYGLTQFEVCELTRIALREHTAPVSRIVAIALRMLRKKCPGLRLVISYAAGERGHHGGVYQAGGWIYEGAKDTYAIEVHGHLRHGRSVGSRYGRHDIEWLRANVDPDAKTVRGLVRHKYLMPLDEKMRVAVARLATPYPKKQSSGCGPEGSPGTASSP
jgi:hypothetical protein